MSDASIYTAFRCPNDLLEKAKVKAKSQRRSLSNYIICSIQGDLDGSRPVHTASTKNRKASESGTTYTAFRCPPTLLEKAKAKAESLRRSLSNYIICILERDLEGDEPWLGEPEVDESAAEKNPPALTKTVDSDSQRSGPHGEGAGSEAAQPGNSFVEEDALFASLSRASDEILDTGIGRLSFTYKVKGIFATQGIRTIRDLAGITAAEMLGWDQFKKTSLKNVFQTLSGLLVGEGGEPSREQPVSCWVQQVLGDPAHSELASCLSRLGIQCDEDYRRKEASIVSFDDRVRLGVLRFQILTRFKDPGEIADPGFCAAASPPWAQERRIEDLAMPNGPRATLLKKGIQQVKDLLSVPSGTILGWDGFGVKKMKAVCISIATSVADGPMDPGALKSRYQAMPVRDWIAGTREGLNQFVPEILTEGELEVLDLRVRGVTLEEIGAKFGRTRARVGQLEDNVVSVLEQRVFWRASLQEKIEDLFRHASAPVFLDELHLKDPSFEGVSSMKDWFVWILKRLVSPAIHRISSPDFPKEVLSRMNLEGWKEVVRKGRSVLKADLANQSGRSEEELREAVRSLIPDGARELRDHLWSRVSQGAVFTDKDGVRVLSAFGSGNEIVELLENSDGPMEWRRIADELGLPPKTILPHLNSLGSVFRFEPGTYGVFRHLGLSQPQLRSLAESCKRIAERNADRQWACSEFVRELAHGDLPYGLSLDRLTQDLVNNALRIHGVEIGFTDLGRMNWRLGSGAESADRSEILPECLRLLRKHGKMTKDELVRLLEEKRGLGARFQVVTFHKDGCTMIRLDSETVGILEMHGGELRNPFTRERLISAVRGALQQQQKGIHPSELGAIPEAFELIRGGIDPVLIVEVCRLSPSISFGKASYLYLTEWEEERRLTIAEAVVRSFEGRPGGMTCAEFEARAVEVIGRKLDWEEIKRAASTTRVRFRQKTGLWSLNPL